MKYQEYHLSLSLIIFWSTVLQKKQRFFCVISNIIIVLSPRIKAICEQYFCTTDLDSGISKPEAIFRVNPNTTPGIWLTKIWQKFTDVKLSEITFLLRYPWKFYVKSESLQRKYHTKFLNLFFFKGNLLLLKSISGSGFEIRIKIHEPNWLGIHAGSGCAALLLTPINLIYSDSSTCLFELDHVRGND